VRAAGLSLFRRDLSVAIRIGRIEVPERGGLSFLQRHSTVLIGVCHLEHVAAEIVHAATVEPAAVAPPVPVAIARGDALLALRCLGIPLSAADRTVAVAVDPLERLLAPVLAAFDELGAERRACGLSLRFGHRAVAVRVDPCKMLGHLRLNFGARMNLGGLRL
jgi:hypothetical protein